MREAALVKEIHDHGVPDMKYLYMGISRLDPKQRTNLPIHLFLKVIMSRPRRK